MDHMKYENASAESDCSIWTMLPLFPYVADSRYVRENLESVDVVVGYRIVDMKKEREIVRDRSFVLW